MTSSSSSARGLLVLALTALVACEDAGDDNGDELGEESAGTAPGWSLAPIIQLNDNGAWSWFMDERVVVHDGVLVVGSVRSLGGFNSTMGMDGWGNVEVATYDIELDAVESIILHEQFEQDDHNNPAFLPTLDGGLLAVYSKHATERMVYIRRSSAGDPLDWSEAIEFDTPGMDKDFRGDNVTYSNLFRWPDQRIYNFFRGYDHDPNYMFSDDDGLSWTYGGRWLEGFDGYSPYLKYAYDGSGRLHFIATEDHPRNYDTSIYHGYIEDGMIHDSFGQALGALGEGLEAGLAVWDLTLAFEGDEDHVAWTVDIELDDEEQPYIAFSVQRDGAGVPRYDGGFDLRYHYGRFDQAQWRTQEIAYAGTRLYSGEDDYSGLIALHPEDPDTVYISTDVDPSTGEPLVSEADGETHHELFRATKAGDPWMWSWEPVTADSDVDNLRPIIPKWEDERTALVWMRGGYSNNRGNWDSAVAAMIIDPD
ncbi:hypothetical protein PPSIR1_18452 [Plesiocystis pacifica SIR-1]|uniref:Uncharacterized protein n=1 Tax=Plesiocystis pacifica SIR-1 TaxID=391625 RepID=A6GCP9_9BACT|nr:BNR-4 repeat-containing protein [Plesiocystis pacifica]EDM76315.1 hypothetical protein PPSIR1_18452 [Plesiocystis pacifica SIR-1]